LFSGVLELHAGEDDPPKMFGDVFGVVEAREDFFDVDERLQGFAGLVKFQDLGRGSGRGERRERKRRGKKKEGKTEREKRKRNSG
jgi:hypothetical protein